MSTRTIEQLERELQHDEGEPLDHAALVAIRAAGLRRRHLNVAGIAVGVLAATVATGLVLSAVLGGGPGRASDPQPAGPPHDRLSPLAERTLAVIPGAQQVSDWQVVITPPDDAVRDWVDEAEVVGAPVDTGAHYYAGVTSFRPRGFPSWLHRGVAHVEQTELADPDGSYPVGSTDMGILVDSGAAYLGCVGSQDSCGPALLTRTDHGWGYEWGMGTDDFLTPGSDMEVFLSKDYSTGAPGELVLAGLPGTDVARVDLVQADGTVVAGHVAPGTIVRGASMMWGTTVGEPAAVVAYDADGRVIEHHRLRACSDPVDCEVR
ncbi:hypothetical protein GON03_19870 [Nocardioides sp. MAH-18]|uniref:Uncharacterized protein n=1 Tax=Nocardioides agri TaxID=2682843 RepID=A0A6L6XVQ0_9ACTN|nr:MULTISPECIES: hypothetical protein [unclassified Nocardioides]MBA2952282.1 hypothetical protein [Nocardioides sp. CGMCC 1.13656]MVQ51444.1 hypothetical protein [Nocardioides sp. MAH-18]